jgi:CheY-like chemotaxis protein
VRAPAEAQRPLIAWVDEDREAQALARGWLLGRCDLVTYADGAHFLEEVEDLRPDLVIFEVRASGGDGLARCRSLRSESALGSIPILFLTPAFGEARLQDYVECGGAGFLAKPFDKKSFQVAVRDLIRTPRGKMPLG